MPAAPDPGVPVHPAEATLNSLIVALATPVPTVRSRSTPAVAFTAVGAAVVVFSACEPAPTKRPEGAGCNRRIFAPTQTAVTPATCETAPPPERGAEPRP